MTTLNSVAELRLIDSRLFGQVTGSAVNRLVVAVNGYATPGDGGDGQYYLDLDDTTSADNGFTVIVTADGKRMKAIFPGGVIPVARGGMVGVPGVGANLLHLADSTMSVETYNGKNNWRKNDTTALPHAGAANDFLIANLTTVPGKLYVKLKASAAVQQIPLGQLSGQGLVPLGRYLVSLKARLTAGTGVAFWIGKSSSQKAANFTPTGTETTYSGYFDVTAAGNTLYIRLADSATSNGSEYTFDDVKLYYMGESSTMTSVPVLESLADESAEFATVLDAAPPGAHIQLGQGRFYRVTEGGFYFKANTHFDFNGGSLLIEASEENNGLTFTDDTLVSGPGLLKVRWGGSVPFGTDRAALLAGHSISEISPTRNVTIRGLSLDVDGENYYGILALGIYGLEISNITFADSSTMRRGIVAAWNGDRDPLVTSLNAPVSNRIYNIHAGVMGQNYPSEGGGAVVAINGGTSCDVFGVFADSTGRSLVNIGSGDYSTTRYAAEGADVQMSVVNVWGCTSLDSSIGIRISGTPDGGTAGFEATDVLPMQVNIFDNFLRSVAGGPAEVADGGIRLDSSIKWVTLRNNIIVGHKHGILLESNGDNEGFYVDSTFHDIIIAWNRIYDSTHSGMELSGLRRVQVARNTIRNSGTAAVAGERNAIRLLAYNDGVELDSNTMGVVDEVETNQVVGINVVSVATNLRISARHNRVYGAAGLAAGGTPYSWGVLATYGTRPDNTWDGEDVFAVLGPVTGRNRDSITTGFGQSDALLAVAAMGSVLKAETVGVSWMAATINSTLLDGKERFIPVYLPVAATITGVKFMLSTAGDYTADNENRIGLYTYSAGTLTLVASSANDGNLWKATADTLASKAFSTPYAAAAGLYFVGVISNWSAVVASPVIKGGATLPAGMVTLDFTNGAKLSGDLTTATLVASQAMSGIGSLTSRMWVALY
jgi:hypothetical protein